MNNRQRDLARSKLRLLAVSIASELTRHRWNLSEEDILNAQVKLERLLTAQRHLYKGEYLRAMYVATEAV